MVRQILHYNVTGGHKVTTTVEDQGMKEGSRNLPQEKVIELALTRKLSFSLNVHSKIFKSQRKRIVIKARSTAG